jgi:2-(1,2-epoxy-1,2-dihydrophenyl)acetyl-CoA isomerase
MAVVRDPVRLEREGNVARIIFARPDILNAIDGTFAEALLRICKTLHSDRSFRVITISGDGRAFMAGGDVGALRDPTVGISERVLRVIDPLHKALSILADIDKPVLAVVHGAVAGAGVSIMLAADLAIAADNTVFTLAYSRLGTSLDGGASWMLPRVVGLRKALELALLSETIDANEAYRLALVNRVVPLANLQNEAEALARRLADGPTFAYGRIKGLLGKSFASSLTDQLRDETQAFLACAATSDFDEGTKAFLEKRSPRFSGS